MSIYNGGEVILTTKVLEHTRDLIERAYSGEIHLLNQNLGWDLAVACKHLRIKDIKVAGVVYQGTIHLN